VNMNTLSLGRFRTILAASGGLMVIAGVATVAAWATGGHVLIQVHSQFAPFHYNAALALVAWGSGLMAIAVGHRLAAFIPASAVIGAGILGLICHFSGQDFGIATWALPPDQLIPRIPPGGIGLGAAVGFVLGGLGLVLISCAGRGVFTTAALAIIGAALLIGSVSALLDSPVGFTALHRTAPPLLLCFGIFLGGLSITAYALGSANHGFLLVHAAPILAWLGGICSSVLLWHSLDEQQSQRVTRDVQIDAAQAHQFVESALANASHTFSEGVDKARSDGQRSEAAKEKFGAFIAANPGILGIGFVGPDRILEWMEIKDGAKLPRKFANLGVGDTLTTAIDSGEPALAQALPSSWNGNCVVIWYHPLQPGSAANGGFVGVLQVQTFFEGVLNPKIVPGYAIEVRDKNERLFGRLLADTEFRDEYLATLPVRGAQQDWQMRIWPTQQVLEHESQWVPRLALGVGIVIVTLFALAIYLAQTARRRTRALEREVRERIAAEAAVKQSEAKYRSLIENLEQGVYLTDKNGRYVAANAGYCRSLGRQEQDLVGHTDQELLSADAMRLHGEQTRQAIGEGKRVEFEVEELIAGVRRTIRRMLTPIRDVDGRAAGVLGIVWDVTEQRAMEAQLQRTGKMDALGQLAGGIAHDFNNLLTAISGNLELMLMALPAEDGNRELATAARSAAARATSLTSQLLGFARQHRLDRQPTNLNGIIEEVVTLLQRTIDPRIRLETGLAADLEAVLADSVQMNQVLLNLCLNARDSITSAGWIRLETAARQFTADDVVSHPASRQGQFVRMRVSDNGAGMSPEVQSRIFEPFFTTKDVGKGTGLGLAMVFGIVKQHNGWIECTSEVGRGTCFEVYLPRTERAPEPVVQVPTPSAHSTGRATILVADDELMVLKLTCAVLRRKGFRVLEAHDGREAVEIFAREHHQIDLALLDLMMPILSGQDAFRQMLRIDPDVKVMFASGYSADQVSEEESQQVLGFVRKPYLPSELVQRIQDALDRCRSAASTVIIETGTQKPVINALVG
jgi:PAS domain S-box-containing protein